MAKQQSKKLSNETALDHFTFERARGVVWVCDIQGSSKILNDNERVAAFEQYLQRFHWTARAAVASAGGEFTKWTGDGFMAWFPLELERDLGRVAAEVVRAIWHLTFFSNVTKLGLEVDTGFPLRHGLTYEPDALLTTIRSTSQAISKDLIGRSVVLAFRLAGVASKFPYIATQRSIVEATKGATLTEWEHWKPRPIDVLQYFKGEKWGTGGALCQREKARS